MANQRSKWRAAVRSWLRLIHDIRAPAVISVAASVALALPSPVHEMYRTLALDAGAQIRVIGLTVLSLLLLMGGLWSLAVATSRSASSDPGRRVVWAACAVLPALGLALGLLRAGMAVRPMAVGQPTGVIDAGVMEALAQTNALPAALRMAAIATLLTGAVAAAGLIVLGRCMSTAPMSWLQLKRVIVPMAGLAIALWIACALEPLRVPRLLGSVSLFLLFMLCLAAGVSVLVRLRERWGVPALSCLIAWALLLSWFNANDNHLTPVVARPAEARQVVPTVVALQEWLQSREDRGTFEARQQPYPIFIISAQGGGHYAAHLTATFLARAQDRCPNFAQHVFAISSVSGGSIGAGIFAGLSKTFAQNGPWQDCKLGALGIGPFEARAKAILDRDLLSPVVAATLFGDLPHMILPFLSPRQDRAGAFDLALEEAWSESLPGTANVLKTAYLAFWDPKQAVPAVLANTTQVENGMRVVVAPFMSIDGPLEAGTLHQRTRRTVYVGMNLLDEGWEALQPDQDIRLSTAIGLSARFPWIMPAARFKTTKTEFRLVDGGYIDNSGDETAFDLIMELGQVDAIGGKLTDGSTVPKYTLHLITLTDDTALGPGEVQGFGDLLSPIRTMLSSRPTRAQMAKHRTRAFINRAPGLTIGTEGDFSSPSPLIQLNHEEFKIPLTWQLSEASRRLIAVQSGEAERCGFGSVFEIVQPDIVTSYAQRKAFDHINDLVRSNNCVACSIAYRLAGRQPTTRQACALP